MRKQTLSYERGIVLFLMGAAFLYSCLRAYGISVFHDEAYDVLVYSPESYWHILTKSNCKHLLNAISIKFLISFLPVSEFVIRLPALMGHALYLLGIYKVLSLFLDKGQRIMGLMALGFNPFMLELFSAARGYALALGFMSLGLYYLLMGFEPSRKKDQQRYEAMALIMMALSVFSNLAFLHLYLSVFILLLGWEAMKIFGYRRAEEPHQRLKNFVLTIRYFLPSMAVVFMCVGTIMVSRKAGDFYHGGGTVGFWHDTAGSLIRAAFYGQKYATALAFKLTGGAVALVMAVTSLTMVRTWMQKERLENIDGYFSVTCLLIWMCAAEIVLQWNVMKTQYVLGRHAIYFFPLFFVLLLLAWAKVRKRSNSIVRLGFSAALWVLVLLTTGHLLVCANLRYYYICPYDANTKEMMAILNGMDQKKALRPGSVSLGTHWIFVPSANFYKVKHKMRWLKWVTQFQADSEFRHDYYYLARPGSRWQKAFGLTATSKIEQNIPLDVVRDFGSTETFLAKALPQSHE